MILFVAQRLHGAALSLRPVALAAAAFCVPGSPAVAASMDEVVVSATRAEQRLSDVLADVTVVDRTAIERSGSNSVAELLSRQPGVQITTTGGPFTTTNVFVRGANTQYTAVYLDGVRLDSQTTSGGVTWQNIPLALIDRVEILRGPAAAVYGSDSMAGVILLFTKQGEAGVQPFVGVGYGTHGTYRAEAGVSGATGMWDYSVSALREGSEGFNSKTVAKADPDKDGYSRTALNAKLGLQINAAHRLQAQWMKTDSRSDYDNGTKKDNAQYKRDMQSVGASWIAQWSQAYRSTVSANTSSDDYRLLPSNEKTQTRLNTYLWQNDFQLSRHQKLTASVERREDQFTNPKVQSGEQSRHQDALALGYGFRMGSHSWQLNARHDKDSEFGGKTTGSAAYGWDFAPQWRISASMGTAFRVPTLYQRFSIYGDATLKPEESNNKELMLRWGQGDNFASATAYRNKLTNMVAYSPGGVCGQSSCYQNVDRAMLEGITLAGAYRFGAVKWHGSVDFQNPRNEKTGNLLARRSQRFVTVGADTVVHAWEVGAEVQMASRRHDKEGDAKILVGYTLLNLSASKSITKDFTLTARLDNALDRHYTLANDYATAGRTFYIGLKWMPQ